MTGIIQTNSDVLMTNEVLERFQSLCDPLSSDTRIDELVRSFPGLCNETPDSLQEKINHNPDLVTQTDCNQQTLLHHLAACTIRTSPGALISVARKNHASITARDRLNNSPVHVALQQFSKDECISVSTLPALLRNISNDEFLALMSPNSLGQTLLHIAAKHQYLEHRIVWTDIFTAVPLLVELLKNATTSDEYEKIINMCDCDGWTALDFALCGSDPSAIQSLVENGARLPLRNCTQINRMIQVIKDRQSVPLTTDEKLAIERALELASSTDERMDFFHNLFRQFIKKGEDRKHIFGLLRNDIRTLTCDTVNQTNSRDGYTYLHLACLVGDSTSVRLLLEKHAQVDIENHNGVTPIYLTVLNGHTDCYMQLKLGGARWTPVKADASHPEQAMLLCDTSAAIAEDLLEQYNVPTDKKYQMHIPDKQLSLLEIAFMSGYFQWMLVLLNKGHSIKSIYET